MQSRETTKFGPISSGFLLGSKSPYRAELKGTKCMGQTGFGKNLWFPAVFAKFCGFLRFSAKICTPEMQ